MCMGPSRAFPEYFPPEFDFETFDRRISKPKKNEKVRFRIRNVWIAETLELPGL